jgi:hypothetical protein
MALGLGVAIVEAYFLVYPRHGYHLPLGFDSSWYVWRARYVGAEGIGPLGTAGRPGHALLSAVLGSVTRLSQLELAVVLPLVLIGVFALALASFWETLGTRGQWEWMVPVAMGGALLGTTRLVSENVANLLNLALVVAALAALALAASVNGPGRPFGGALLLMVGAGLAHWVFLAVVAATLAVAMIMAIPSSLRQRGGGASIVRTDAGLLAALILATGGLLAGLVAGLLNAPFRTFEIREDPGRFLPKLREDLHRLVAPALLPVGAVGATAWATRDPTARDGDGRTRRTFSLRILAAWTAVSLVGIVYGMFTLRLPPHRFLALIVAVPLALALAEAVAMLGVGTDRLARRTLDRPRAARVLRFAVIIVAVAILSLPGALGWYHHGPGLWLDEKALQQAETAGSYVGSLPPGQPVVFLVGPIGPAGVLSVPLKERTIRVGLPSNRQTDLHVFPGEPRDLLAGRRSVAREPFEAGTLPYWGDVLPLLPARPPVVILAALAPTEFATAVEELHAPEIAPGVAVLRGPLPGRGIRPAVPPMPVPGVWVGGLWATALLGLLMLSGWGWVSLLLPGTPPRTRAGLAPAFGAASVMIGSLLAAKAGIRLAGAGGVVTFAVIAGAGLTLTWKFHPPQASGVTIGSRAE